MTVPADPAQPEARPGDCADDRVFWSESKGYVILDHEGAVWECDFSGFRITDVPADAVELVPAVPAVPVAAPDRDALLAEAGEALRKVWKAALVVKPTLDKPYPDAPDTTPWERFMRKPASDAYNLGCRIRDLLRATPAVAAAVAAPAPATDPEQPREPCPEGYYYLGQGWFYCEVCDLPAWEHDGIAVNAPGAGPFDDMPFVLRPWEPGEANRMRDRWTQ